MGDSAKINKLIRLREILKVYLKNLSENAFTINEWSAMHEFWGYYNEVLNLCDDWQDLSKCVPRDRVRKLARVDKMLGKEYIIILHTGEQLIAYLDALIPQVQMMGEKNISIQNNPDIRKVFIVHGRDKKIKDSMFEFLRSIDVSPIEWIEAKRMTGKASPFIGDVLNAAFSQAQAIIVLLTPDDLVQLKPSLQKDSDSIYEKELSSQARPNVIFEAGMALGLHEDRTILVQLGKLRPFSDIAGRHYLEFDGSPESRTELASLLELTGVKVNLLDKRDWLTVGNFTINS